MAIIRKTKSVKALLEAFENKDRALSTLELVERFQADMNKSTVYRILERLEGEGVLHSFTGRDGISWYAINTTTSCEEHTSLATHPHFQCSDCGKTECLPIDIAIPKVSAHQIDSVSLLLVGKCPDCSA